jgi:hypothetical protein
MNLGRQALNISLAAIAGFTPSGTTDAELTNQATNPNFYKNNAQTHTLSAEEIAAITATFASSAEANNGILAQETIIQEGRGIRATVTLTQRLQTDQDPQSEEYNPLIIKINGTYDQEYQPSTGKGEGVLSVGYDTQEITSEDPFQSILMYDEEDGSPIFTGIQYSSNQGGIFTVAMPASQVGKFLITSGRQQSGTSPSIFALDMFTGNNDTVTEADVLIEQIQ